MKKIMIWLLMLVLLSSVVAAGITTVNSSMAYYKGDGSPATSYPDATGHQPAGTIQGAFNGSTGYINQSFYYAGNDYIDTNIDIQDMDNGGGVTISFWINSTDNTDFQFGGRTGDATTRMDFLFNTGADGHIATKFRGAGGKCFWDTDVALDFTDGTYHHILITQANDCSDMRVYIDNNTRAVTRTDNSPPAISSTDNFFIGCSHSAAAVDSCIANGQIDEFNIYNFTFSEADKSLLYKLQTLGYQWPFPDLSNPLKFQTEGNTYNSTIIEGSTAQFFINATWDNTTITNVSGFLTYDGVNYTASQNIITGNYSRFNVNITIPPIASVSESKTFNWNFTFYNVSNSKWTNVSSSSMTTLIYQIYIYNCSAGNETLKFWFKDEDDNTTMAAWYEAVYTVRHKTALTRNYTFDINNQTNFSICISPNWATYTADAIMEYSAPSYAQRNYYFDNVSLDNATDTIYLYLPSSYANVTATLYDENGDELEGYFIKVYRYYFSCDCYQLAEVVETNFVGQGLLHLILNDVFYKFIIEKDATIYEETSKTKITDTTIVFYINLQGAIGETFKQLMGINYNFSFQPSGNYFDFTYSDSNNLVSRGCLYVYVVDGVDLTYYNHSCINAAGGSLFIYVNNLTDTTYKANAIVRLDSQNYVLDTLYRSFTYTVATFGSFGLLLTVIIILTIALAGVWSPPVAVMLIGVGVAFTRLVGLHSLEWYIVISLCAICGVIAWVISDKS